MTGARWWGAQSSLRGVEASTRTSDPGRDKPGGLVVDYLGIAHELIKALANYTESGGRSPGVPKGGPVLPKVRWRSCRSSMRRWRGAS